MTRLSIIHARSLFVSLHDMHVAKRNSLPTTVASRSDDLPESLGTKRGGRKQKKTRENYGVCAQCNSARHSLVWDVLWLISSFPAYRHARVLAMSQTLSAAYAEIPSAFCCHKITKRHAVDGEWSTQSALAFGTMEGRRSISTRSALAYKTSAIGIASSLPVHTLAS
ncbi:hypothetical protein K438DRAFT_1975748 [Mycena galopus ATCC 62051]|nr:hypothetical protein K438DRAFT_1975748 [Mycena galopus ATCC 62051]